MFIPLDRLRSGKPVCPGCPDVPGEGGRRRYVAFFLAALALALTMGTTLGAVSLARLTGTWGPLHRPSVWAHGYAQTFGFFALFIMGFAYHALPRFFQTPLRHAAVVPWSFWLQVGGACCVSLAFVFASQRAQAFWVLGALSLVAASALFGWAVLATVGARRVPVQRIEPWILAGAVWLVVGSLLALAAAAEDDAAAHHVLWPVMLYGFAGSWVLGVGRRLFPASLGWRSRSARGEAWAIVLYQLGVAAWSAGAWPAPGAALSVLRGMGATALLIAVPLQCLSIGLVGPRRDSWRSVDRDYERYVYAAWVWMFVSLALGPLWSLASLAGLADDSILIGDLARHTLALGFLTQIIMGIAGAYVPVFGGTRLWSRRAHRAAFWLLNTSVVLRGMQAVAAHGRWPEAWPLIALTAPPAVVAFVLFAVNMVMAIRPGTHIMRRPPRDSRTTWLGALRSRSSAKSGVPGGPGSSTVRT